MFDVLYPWLLWIGVGASLLFFAVGLGAYRRAVLSHG